MEDTRKTDPKVESRVAKALSKVGASGKDTEDSHLALQLAVLAIARTETDQTKLNRLLQLADKLG